MKEPKCHRCVWFQQEAKDKADIRSEVIAEIVDYLYAVNGWSAHVEALLARLK
jgi:hypothetical protein